MRAVVYDEYGPPEVLRIADLPKPVPKDDEVLIRVRATTVNSGDVRLRALDVPPGHGADGAARAGHLPAPQQSARERSRGRCRGGRQERRAVQAGRPRRCLVGFKSGCHAEYRAVPEDGCIAKIPDALGLRRGGGAHVSAERRRSSSSSSAKLKAGESILINGASGAVGVMAVQLAKHMGAEVTGVCSARNAELVRSLGADHVIDYATEDFTKSGKTYDLVMDNHGNAPLGRIKHMLKPGGRFLMVIVKDLWQMLTTTSPKAW